MKSIAKKAQKYFWMLALSMMILPFADAADTTTHSAINTTTKPTPAQQQPTNTNTDTKPSSVNINTADEKMLAQMLEGIGKKKAKAIVDYRKQNGPFKTPADVMKVKGIGKKTFAKNKDKIRVSDEQTAKIATSSEQPQTSPISKDKGNTQPVAKAKDNKQGTKNKEDGKK